MEQNLDGHVSFVQSQLPGMSVQRSDDLTIVDSGLGSDTFNKVLSSRMSGAGVDQNISQALSHFRDNGRPFTWWVGPCSMCWSFRPRCRVLFSGRTRLSNSTPGISGWRTCRKRVCCHTHTEYLLLSALKAVPRP